LHTHFISNILSIFDSFIFLCVNNRRIFISFSSIRLCDSWKHSFFWWISEIEVKPYQYLVFSCGGYVTNNIKFFFVLTPLCSQILRLITFCWCFFLTVLCNIFLLTTLQHALFIRPSFTRIIFVMLLFLFCTWQMVVQHIVVVIFILTTFAFRSNLLTQAGTLIIIIKKYFY
jgi:hypothetical protein